MTVKGVASDTPMHSLSRLSFWAVLLIASALRLWNLGQNDFGNIYYAATVRSMAESWHNFFYASFDPAGFLSVDKPPVAFWIQAFSVRLLGYDGFSLHLPQAIEGILSVALVCHLTRRVAGPWSSALAALVMALNPASVAADRSNLADSCLVLVLLLAAWTLFRATETGRLRWVLLAMILVGVAFNTKLLSAYLVLPTFLLLYAFAAPADRKTRLVHVSAGMVVLLAVSFSWPLMVDLTPKDSRPYVGDTPDNSAVSLGLGRRSFRPGGPDRPPPGGPRRRAPIHLPGGPSPEQPDGPGRDAGRRPPGHDGSPLPPFMNSEGGPPSAEEPTLTGHGGRPGPFRLANRDLAGHISWWMPLAGVGLLAFARLRSERPSSRTRHALFLWTGWLVTHAVVFSFAGAPIHPYYLNAISPALAVLVGITSVYLWRALERGGLWLLLPAAAIALTALWQAKTLGSYPAWRQWMLPALSTGALVSVCGTVLASRATTRSDIASRLRTGGMTIGIAVLSVCPALWAITPILAPGGRMVPIADPSLLDHPSGSPNDLWNGTDALAEFLRANCRNERFLMAVPDVHLAAPIIIKTGEAVMAYGGFTGEDPILTASTFATRVESGQVRFVMLPDSDRPARTGPHAQTTIDAWVRHHGKEVPPDLWRHPGTSANGWADRPLPPWGPTSDMVRQMFTRPGVRLYDCRPTPKGWEKPRQPRHTLPALVPGGQPTQLNP